MGTGQLPRHKKPPTTKSKDRLPRRNRSSAPTYAALAIAQWDKEDARAEEIEKETRQFTKVAHELGHAMRLTALGTAFNIGLTLVAISYGYSLEALVTQALLWIYPILWWKPLPRLFRNLFDLRYNCRLAWAWIKVAETTIPNHIDNPSIYRRQIKEIETLGNHIALLLSGRHPS